MATKHKCLASGCKRQVDVRYLMCGVRWALVPVDVQREVYAAYRPGQDITTASDAWHRAADKAIAAVTAALEAREP